MTTPLTRHILTQCACASLAFFAALLVCLVLLPPEVLDLEDGPKMYAVDEPTFDLYGEQP